MKSVDPQTKLLHSKISFLGDGFDWFHVTLWRRVTMVFFHEINDDTSLLRGLVFIEWIIEDFGEDQMVFRGNEEGSFVSNIV